MFNVEILRKGVCDSDIKAINALLDQLLESTESKRNLTRLTITDRQETAVIMVVRHDTAIVGLSVFSEKPTLTRSVGWIDDLIVDRKYRRKGIGETLIRAAIGAGVVRKLERLNGTCRPKKMEANKLCLKVGFKLVGTVNGTNFYTYEYSQNYLT